MNAGAGGHTNRGGAKPSNDEEAADGLASEVADWMSQSRIVEAGAQRARQRWLELQATEDTSIRQVIIKLAERGHVAQVFTSSGRVHRGRFVEVGHDFCVLQGSPVPGLIVPMHALMSFRPSPMPGSLQRIAPITPSQTTFHHLLGGLAADRTRVSIWVQGGSAAQVGRLAAVGRDLVVVKPESGGLAELYVQLDAVSEVSLLGSG